MRISTSSNSYSISITKILLLLSVAFVAVGVGADVIPAGSPYLNVTVSLADATKDFDLVYVREDIGLWVKTNVISNIQIPGSINIVNLKYGSAGKDANMTVYISDSFGNGHCYDALLKLHKAMETDQNLIPGYIATNMVVKENPPTGNNKAEFLPATLPNLYVGEKSAPITLRLQWAPPHKKSVTYKIESAGLTIEPSELVITWPDNEATFTVTSNTDKKYDITAKATSADPPTQLSNYMTPASESVTVLSQLPLVFTPADPNVITYNETNTEYYYFNIPDTYRDSRANVVIEYDITPRGLDCFPSKLHLTTRGVKTGFYCKGDVGSFNLTFSLNNAAGTDNKKFTISPNNAMINITITESLKINVSAIPDAYMVAPPATSEYGGAFSQAVTITLEKPPKKSLIIYPSGPDCEFTPSVISFSPTVSTQSFHIRGLTVGRKRITFSLSSLSAGDYFLPPARDWMVYKGNPNCKNFTKDGSAKCFEEPGCQWWEDRHLCYNRTIPVTIEHIPVLFDGEPSDPLTLRLGTPVNTSLIVRFVAASRLSFEPPLLRFLTGEQEKKFTVIGFLGYKEPRLQQSFSLRLSGADANYYTQLVSEATISPLIKCSMELTPPFYVSTESEIIKLQCDAPPEKEAKFTPTPVEGIEFVFVNGTFSNGTFTMNSTTTEAYFYLESVDMVVATFGINFTVSGINAPRYEPIPVLYIRSLPRAAHVPMPDLTVTAFEESVEYHTDLTVMPPNPPLTVTIHVVERDTGAPMDEYFEFDPPVLVYNESQRIFITVLAKKVGNFTVMYNITGENYRNYDPASNSSITVLSPVDGKAWTARLHLGFQPRTVCRINVGRNSQNFRGQDPVDIPGQFCANLPRLYANVSQGETLCPAQKSEERCRHIVATTGTICFWLNGSCTYFPEIQGEVRDLAYGSGFVLYVLYNHTVWSVGKPAYGQLGHFEKGLAQVKIGENISSVVAGTAHSMALAWSGRVYVWGANHKGQLGISSFIRQTDSVHEIKFPRYENITCISAGTEHAGAVSLSGAIYMWGSNEYGQTGNYPTYRDYHRQWIPISRDTFDGDPIVSLQCGEYHTMVATEFAQYTFGYNNQGQLGRPGWDEWKPAKTVLYSPAKFVDRPTYPGFLSGRNCPKPKKRR